MYGFYYAGQTQHKMQCAIRQEVTAKQRILVKNICKTEGKVQSRTGHEGPEGD